MQIRYDIWLDNDGNAFGEQCFRLLKAVDGTGSLSKAAEEMNLSYSTAFRVLTNSEKRLGFALLERKIGGVSGGGSLLTPKAQELMSQYSLFTDEIIAAIPHIYRRCFGVKKGLNP